MTRATDFTNTLSCVCFVLAALLSASCDRGAPAPTAGEHGLVPVEESAEPNGATRSESAPAVGLQAELDALQSRLYKSELELAVTRTQLASSEARRMEREREWLEYSSLLGKVSPSRLPSGKIFAVEGAQSAPSAPPGLAAESDAAPPGPALDTQIQVRSLEIARALRTLFTLEQVQGLDPLECGTLDGTSIGPVVFRMLDGRGHLAGSLYANHLSMEASRSAHTLTLILEDGYETRAGEKIAFVSETAEGPRANVRRIVLDGVDPKSWAGEFHELFGEHGLDLSGDDGLWDLMRVKQALNEALLLHAAGGAYRLRNLGGVQDAALLDVHLERLDEKGLVERRLFADRMRILRADGAVELLLERGIQVRGENERVPFLDGRYRIRLPLADPEVWTRAGLPGLAPPPGTTVDPAHSGSNLH